MTATEATPIDDGLIHIGRRAQFITLGAVMLGMLLSAIDQTIVGTAMPRIVADLNGVEHYSWVVTGYLIASTTCVPIFGKLSDIFGRKWLYMAGIATFLLGSMLAGLSQSMAQLIAFRTLQGFGAGMMTPIAQAIIGDIFTPAERGKYQGLLIAVFGMATIFGPALGGFITDNFGWHWVFFVNLPFGIAALVAVFLVLPSHTALHRRPKIDWWGSAALIAAVVPLLLALTWGGSTYAWNSPQIIGLLAAAIVFAITFILVERRAEAPTIPLDLFRNRIFAASATITFLNGMGMFATILYIPLFVQVALGDTATNSGFILTPLMLGVIAMSVTSGLVLSRTGRYKALAVAGTGLTMAGMLLLSQMSMDTDSATLVRNMVVLGFGMGISLALYTIVVQNAFPVERLGVVTATLVFCRSIGGVVGVAVLGSVMTNHLAGQIQSGMATLPPGVAAKLGPLASNPQALVDPAAQAALKEQLAAMGPAAQQIASQISDILRGAVASAVTQVFLVGSGLIAVAFVTSFFLREIPLRATRHSPVYEVEQIGFELGADLADELQVEIVLDAEEREAAAAGAQAGQRSRVSP